MKKYFIALLSVLTVLAFAASAFALHTTAESEYTAGLVKAATKAQLTLGGELRIRGEFSKNTDDFNSDQKYNTGTTKGSSDNKQYYDERARLNVRANVSQNTFGFVELETGSGSNDTFKWGSDDNAKRGSMDVRQAYIATQGKGLGMLSGLKAGHMLLALGNNLFFDHTKSGDDAVLLWTTLGPGELSLIAIKLSEGAGNNGNSTTAAADTTKENDDTDAYVIAYGMNMGGVNVSADVTDIRDHSKQTYDKGSNLYNIGVRADADLKVVKVKGDVEFQAGKASEKATAPTEIKNKGIAFMLGVEAPIGPVSIRANAAYGSGDKTDTADKNEAFQTFLSDNQYYTYVYDYRVKGATLAKNGGISNTTYGNIGVTAKPMDALKLAADVYVLKASKEVSSATDKDSKKVGWEIDAKAEYQIDTNLAYFVEGGYLSAGDFYKNIRTDGKDPDNPYAVRHGLLLKF
ncbi:MAG: alginate export family protein [Nitrospirae bacterium]|nr:alginate export family protein [Nitrospirota bacterium]